jgi:hypothetical protein
MQRPAKPRGNFCIDFGIEALHPPSIGLPNSKLLFINILGQGQNLIKRIFDICLITVFEQNCALEYADQIHN